MLFKANINLPKNSGLRCVWVPAHAGANAPLIATWINLRQESVHNSAEGDLWACAA
jgi:hypothetical protein